MNDEKAIEYDYQGAFSYYGNCQSFATLMAGFAFTGTVLVLTSIGDPSAFVSQVVLFILFCATYASLNLVLETIFVQMKLCIHSPKPIIPSYPARNRLINYLAAMVISLIMSSIPMMFLLKNLIPLFALTMCIVGVVSFVYPFYRFMPLAKEWESAGLW
jgi:hypothetical protein